jgi:hypothetical protein
MAAEGHVKAGMRCQRHCNECGCTTEHVAETSGGFRLERTSYSAGDGYVRRIIRVDVPVNSCERCGARVAYLLCAKRGCPRSLPVVDVDGVEMMIGFVEGVGRKHIPLTYDENLTFTTRHYLYECAACAGADTGGLPPAGWSAAPM